MKYKVGDTIIYISRFDGWSGTYYIDAIDDGSYTLSHLRNRKKWPTIGANRADFIDINSVELTPLSEALFLKRNT